MYHHRTFNQGQALYPPSTTVISDVSCYKLNDKDVENFIFLKKKYLQNSVELANKSCAWENKTQTDFRRQFVGLIRLIADSKKNPSQNYQPNQSSQASYLSEIINVVDNYLALLCDNKFQQAETLIKKSDFTQCPRFHKRLNVFSLKMLKYESVLQENNRNKNAQIELDFYHKIVQNMSEPKGLQSFVRLAQNKKSPYMDQNLSNKLQKQVTLSYEKDQLQKICKKYEKIIDEMNYELKKTVIDFKYTNHELSIFSIKDFNSKSTQESGIKLKKSMTQLIYNISSSKQKKILTEVEKTQAVKANHELWTYNLLDHFLKIVSNNFQSCHISALQSFVTAQMGNNKPIMEAIQTLNKAPSAFQQMREFEKSLEGLSIKIPSNIQNIQSLIKQKTSNYQNMVKLFKREFIFRMMNQIHSDQIVSGNQTFLENIIVKYREWIDSDVLKSIQKLALRTGKQKGVLQLVKSKLNEVLNLTGNQPMSFVNMNPNTIDFYIELQSMTQKIWTILQKSNSKEKLLPSKMLIPDKLEDRFYNAVGENIRSNKNPTGLDFAAMEQNLQYQLERCYELKNKLLKQFGNFDKEILKNIVTTYTVQGNYEITRESFDNYVKKKTDQLNKIFKDFESAKKNPAQIFQKNEKITNPIERQKVKVAIGEKQMGIDELKQEYQSLNEDLAHAIAQHSKKQDWYKGIIAKLQKKLQNKNESPALNRHSQSQSYTTGCNNQNVTGYLENTKQPYEINQYLNNYQQPQQRQSQGHQAQITSTATKGNSETQSLNLLNDSLKTQIFQLMHQIEEKDRLIYSLQKTLDAQKQQNAKLQSEIQQLPINIEKNNVWKRQMQKTLMQRQYEKLIADYQNIFVEQITVLNGKISQLLVTQKLYNQLKQKQLEMRDSLRLQKQTESQELDSTKKQLETTKKQLESANKYRQEYHKLKQQIYSLQKTHKLISDELVQTKDKYSSTKYTLGLSKQEVQVKIIKIQQLQKNIREQQSQITALKQQQQQRAGNVFKPKEEAERPGTRFKSLRDEEDNHRRTGRTVSKPKVDIVNRGFTTNVKTTKQEGSISMPGHELKMKQNTEQLQKQFQIELEKQSSQLKEQFAKKFAKEKQVSEEQLVQLNKDLVQLRIQCEELTKQKEKLTQENKALTQGKQQVTQQQETLKQSELTQDKQKPTKLTQQHQLLTQQNQWFTQDKQKLNKENGQLKRINALLTQEKQAMTQQKQRLAALIQENQRLVEQNKLLVSENKQLNAKIYDLVRQKDKLTNQKQNQLQERFQLNGGKHQPIQSNHQTASLPHLMDSYSEQHKQLIDQNKQLNQKNQQLMHETKELSQHNQKLVQESKNLNEHNQQIINFNKQLIEEKKQIIQQKQQLFQQNKYLQSERQSFSRRNEQLQRQKQQIHHQLQKLNRQRQQLTQQRVELAQQQNKQFEDKFTLTSQQTSIPSKGEETEQKETPTEKLTAQNTQLTSKIKQLTKEYQQLTHQNQQLIEEKQQLIQEKQKQKLQADKLYSDMEYLEVTNKQLKEQKQRYKKQLYKLNKQFANLQKENKNNLPEEKVCIGQSTQSDDPSNNLIQQQTIIQEYLHQIDSLSTQITSLNQQLSKSLSKLQEAEAKIADFATKRAQSEVNLDLFKQDITNKQLLLKQTQEKVAQLIKQKQNYGPDMQNLKSQKQSYEYTIQDLREKVSTLQSQKDELRVRVKTQKEEFDKTKKQLQDDLQNVKVEADKELDSQLTQMKLNCNTLQQNLIEEKTVNNKKTETIAKIEKDLNEKNKTIEELQMKVNQLEDKIKLQIQKNLSKSSVDDQLSRQKQINKINTIKIQRLQKQLQQSQTSCKELEEIALLSSQASSMGGSTAQLAAKNEEIVELQQKNQKLTEQKQNLTKQLNQAQAQLEAKDQDLREKEIKLKNYENIIESMDMKENEEMKGQPLHKTSIKIMKKGKISELEETRVEDRQRKGSFESSWSLESSID